MYIFSEDLEFINKIKTYINIPSSLSYIYSYTVKSFKVLNISFLFWNLETRTIPDSDLSRASTGIHRLGSFWKERNFCEESELSNK